MPATIVIRARHTIEFCHPSATIDTVFAKRANKPIPNSAEITGYMKLDGECHANIMGYDIFEMLPFVLLDNAMKFSPSDENIHVTCFEEKSSLAVTISSIGPPLALGEEVTIFDELVRGKHAPAVASGSGLGLYIAKQICDLHSIQIGAMSIASGGKHWFTVNLQFDPKTFAKRVV